MRETESLCGCRGACSQFCTYITFRRALPWHTSHRGDNGLSLSKCC